jgi:hypothetical protein
MNPVSANREKWIIIRENKVVLTTLKMTAAFTFETPVYVHKTTRCHNSEAYNISIHVTT